MQVLLERPSERPYQMVYRQERDEPLEVAARPELKFVFWTSPWPALGQASALRRHLGWLGTVKTLVKLASGRRWFYAILQQGDLVSTGWCSKGFCTQYQVEPEAVVIGPIHTLSEVRGQGIATYALRRAINALIESGCRLFYIDTSDQNRQSQRVIAKCEFGEPVSTYWR